MRLRDIAPRLGRARDALLEERRRERAGREHLGRLKLAAQRNLAHRELQLARAYATGNGAYIVERQRKLKAAQKELRKFEKAEDRKR